MPHETRFPRVLDSTMLATWRCPRKFQLSFLQRYGGAGVSIHLHAGAAFAKGLEVARRSYYGEDKPLARCTAEGTLALIKYYGADTDSEGTSKTLDRMVGALEFYFDRYPMDSDPCRLVSLVGQPACEWSFALPLPFNHPVTGEPLLYAGRTDAVVDFAGGRYVLDDKTTSSLGESWSRQWSLRSQFTGYAWAASTLGMPVKGVVVRGVSILKTKYDTAQAIVGQAPWKIDRWIEHRDHEIKAMLAAYQDGYFDTVLGEMCNEYGGCQFKAVCEVPPAQQESFLTTNFVEHEWSPLTLHKA